MYELHKNEQYFFQEKTLEALADFLSRYERPCCLCAPMLGKRLAERGFPVTVLDNDKRFARVKGFQSFDLYRPVWLSQRFDVILCDPPFFSVSLAQLFVVLRQLSHYEFAQPILVSYLSRRATAVTATFYPFGLQPAGLYPQYQTVQKVERNHIEFFSNLAAEDLATLQNSFARLQRSKSEIPIHV